MSNCANLYNTYVTAVALQAISWRYYLVFVGLNLGFGTFTLTRSRMEMYVLTTTMMQVSSGSSWALKLAAAPSKSSTKSLMPDAHLQRHWPKQPWSDVKTGIYWDWTNEDRVIRISYWSCRRKGCGEWNTESPAMRSDRYARNMPSQFFSTTIRHTGPHQGAV